MPRGFCSENGWFGAVALHVRRPKRAAHEVERREGCEGIEMVK